MGFVSQMVEGDLLLGDEEQWPYLTPPCQGSRTSHGEVKAIVAEPHPPSMGATTELTLAANSSISKKF